MTTVSDLQRKPPKIILYGPIGSGKTALAMTGGADVFICDLEDGLTTGLTLKDKFSEERLKCEVMQFLEDDPLRAVSFNRLKNFVLKLPARIRSGKPPSEGGFPYKILVIDSLTSLGENACRYITGNSGDPNKYPQINDWGPMINEIQIVMSVLKSLPIIVILIGHDEEKTFGKLGASDSKEVLSLAVPTKKLIRRIPRFYDEIWYCKSERLEGKKQRHYLHTRKDDQIEARSRLNLPDGTTYFKVDGDKNIESVGIWEILEKVGFKKEMVK